MRPKALTSCLILALLVSALSAQAQSSASGAASTESTAPLALHTELGTSKLDAQAIRRALELELKRPVALVGGAAPSSSALLTVVTHANRTVTVSYLDTTGTTRTRTIGLPQDAARSAEVIALLAGNLSRDEAAELLAALAARGTAPAAAEPPPTVPTAPATPAQPPKVEGPPPTPVPQTPVAPHEQPHTVPPAEPFPKPNPPFNLTFFAPLGLYPHSNRLLLNGELGLIFSHVGELRGVGINALALRTQHDVVGASLASVYNASGGFVQGATLSGVFNGAHGMRGVQLAGVSNFAGSVRGAQIAGAVNIADEVNGAQIAGATNIAHQVSGVQLGVVNIAGEVDGAQIGVINVAKHVHGAAVGLVSIAGNGRVQPVLWASTLTPLNAAAKFSVGPLYTQVGLGYAPGSQAYLWELGLGAHLASGRYFLEPGVHYSEMRGAKQPFQHELLERLHYRLAAGLDLGGASPFIGAALVQRFAHASDAPASSAVSLEGLAGVAFF